MSESIRSGTVQPRDALPMAREWFMANYDELCSRTAACFARTRAADREESMAEAMALAYAAVTRTAQRGNLSRLTVYWLVVFSVRQVRCGRQCAGTSSRCVLSPHTQRRGRVRVTSLEALDPRTSKQRYRDALSNGDAEDPSEIVRRRMDYPLILAEVSASARATFDFLAVSHGAGRQSDLADELGVTPGRVTQLKREIGAALTARGYAKPLVARSAAHG